MDWKSKINSVVLIFFCLMAVASALTIGQVLTQEQINGTDIQATSLEPEIESKEKTNSQVRVWFSYFTLEELEDGIYKVKRKTNVAVYNLDEYKDCRKKGETEADCKNRYIPKGRASMISQAKTLIKGEKASLEELQGQDYSSEITAEDFDISDKDLQ